MNKKYQEYLQSSQWEEKKREVFARALKNANSKNIHGVCEKCGYEPYKPCLQIHHKTYEHIFNEPLEDLILLCPHCHKMETEKVRENRVSKKELSFEIKKHLAVLSKTEAGYSKELNLVSWNGGKAKYDLRMWKQNEDGTKNPLKGIPLDESELEALIEAIKGLEMLE